jgi:3-(3-hydroxy-phenyl)propionate hydroxylase
MLIAGDAAHQTPPFMGQGMCAGVRDASNLAWKLADVITGAASGDLLDTYEAERSPHVREFIEAAIRLGAVIRSIGPEQGGHSSGGPPKQFATPQPRLGPGVHDGAPGSARISEQPILADGRRLDDLVGYAPMLLVTPGIAPVARDIANGIAVIAAEPGAPADLLAKLEAKALLLRPDRYIAGIAHDKADLKALIETYRRGTARRTTAGSIASTI